MLCGISKEHNVHRKPHSWVPRATTHSNEKRMTLSIKTRLPTPSLKDGNIPFEKGRALLWNSKWQRPETK